MKEKLGNSITYAVDIVFCLDATSNMHLGVAQIKDNALYLSTDLRDKIQKLGRTLSTLRVKVILFGDLYVDVLNSLIESHFFHLPSENEDFFAFLNTTRTFDRSDVPRSGLEALALAIKSDWSKTGHKHRQIIVILTDGAAHKFEKYVEQKPSNYPSDLPKNFEELTDWWEGQTYMGKTAKRLLMFAPDAYPWTKITNSWEATIHYEVVAGNGCVEIENGSATLNAIVNGIRIF